MFTGKYPREFGVFDNGTTSLGKSHTTLAELAHEAGYATGAVVASFVLDSRFGLDQGFDTYLDEMDPIQEEDTDSLEAQLSGDQVTDRALEWLSKQEGKPFFCWVHYYDAHDPHTKPKGLTGNYATVYDSEIAFVDLQIARLLDWLKKTERDQDTLIVIVGDHGESFGEHGEKGHGSFLYDTTQHVPMIVVHPGAAKAGLRVPQFIEIIDLFATVCSLMGWQPPDELLSRSLHPALATGEIEETGCYCESLHAYNAYHWAEQHALIKSGWKYISSTKPELYDLTSDPGEKQNLIATKADLAEKMREELRARFDELPVGMAEQAGLDEEARKAIETLGYVSGGGKQVESKFLTPGLADPKDMMDVAEAKRKAKKFLEDGKFEEAYSLIEPAVKKSPDSTVLLFLLGACQLRKGEDALAEETFRKLLNINPESSPLLARMGAVLMKQGKLDKAIEHYRLALKFEDDAESHAGLAAALQAKGQIEEAIGEFKKALALSPSLIDMGLELLNMLAARGRANEMITLLEDLTQRNPRQAKPRVLLGLAYSMVQQPARAEEQLKSAISLDPNLGIAYNKLGICQAFAGRVEDAKGSFMKAMQFEDSKSEAYFNYGVTMERARQDMIAVDYYEKALKLRPAYPDAIAALAGGYLRQRRVDRAVQTLRDGAKECPADVRILNSLAEFLSMSADSKIRDGKAAVTFAKEACRLTQNANPAALATLAAAHAEVGEFAEAKKVALQAVDLATKSGNKALADQISRQLKEYEQGRPVRSASF
jgi:tetratricopeptide (TPR) repeat protein